MGKKKRCPARKNGAFLDVAVSASVIRIGSINVNMAIAHLLLRHVSHTEFSLQPCLGSGKECCDT